MSLAVVRDLHGGDRPLDAEEGVSLVLSRCLTGVRNGGESHTNLLCKMLAFYGRAPIPRKGRFGPASHPDLPAGPWPTGSGALRVCGLTGRELRERFERQRFTVGPVAALEADTLTAFVPRLLWPVVERLALDGPGVAGVRADLAIRAAASEPVGATKRRPAGHPATGTIQSWRDGLKRLFAVLVDPS